MGRARDPCPHLAEHSSAVGTERENLAVGLCCESDLLGMQSGQKEDC